MQKLDLNTVGGGAALEKFDAELAKVITNIRDPNTDPKAKREIVLKFVFSPDVDRESAAVVIGSSCKLASDAPHGTKMFITNEAGQDVALAIPETLPLFEAPANVKTIKKTATKEGD